MQPQKSGWKTSEFWMALGVNVMHMANTLGWVPQSDNAALQGEWGKIISGAFGAVALVAYIWSRVAVKTS